MSGQDAVLGEQARTCKDLDIILHEEDLPPLTRAASPRSGFEGDPIVIGVGAHLLP
jgi:hypothetical protein